MKSVKLEFLDQARADLVEGFWFYESQQAGLGGYFLQNIHLDIESLRQFSGIHRKVHGGYHRLLSKRFPFAIYYTTSGNSAHIHAVLDCRRDPAWMRRKLE